MVDTYDSKSYAARRVGSSPTSGTKAYLISLINKSMKLLRILKGIVLSIGVGFGAAFVSAIILAVINIYLSGHGNDIFDKDIFNGPVLYGGIDDIILIVVSLSAMVATFILYIRRKNKKSPSVQ